MQIQTRLTLAGQRTDEGYRSIVPPIYQSAIFRFESPDEKPEYDYSRSGNPTRTALQEALALLEGGAGATATNTGMAAVAAVLSLYDAGSHIVCSHDCYGGTERLLTYLARQRHIEVTYANLAVEGGLEAALKPETVAIFVETPSNPLLSITDLDLVGQFCRSHGLDFIVDNTFLSPIFQRPIDFGADFVVHSTTKYLNGHSDVVGGAIISRTKEQAERVAFAANVFGWTASPFDCWLVLRGLKTLPLRAQKHEENAFVVAQFLAGHDLVDEVFYPGLADHPGHDVAARQQSGFGGIVTFSVCSDLVDVRTLLTSTRVFALAESLGGVESLIEQPSRMSHNSMSDVQKLAAGLHDGVVRLSIGIEAADDLLEDLDRALRCAVVGRAGAVTAGTGLAGAGAANAGAKSASAVGPVNGHTTAHKGITLAKATL